LTENDGHNDDLNDDDGVGWIERWFDPSRRLLRRKKSIKGAGMIQTFNLEQKVKASQFINSLLELCFDSSGQLLYRKK
jgi:hypothetical protein